MPKTDDVFLALLVIGLFGLLARKELNEGLSEIYRRGGRLRDWFEKRNGKESEK